MFYLILARRAVIFKARARPRAANTQKHIMFTATTLGPVGVDKAKLMTMPATKQKEDSSPDHITTLLKVLHSRIEVRGGKIIRLDMSSAPIIRMPSTMVTAVRQAKRVL